MLLSLQWVFISIQSCMEGRDLGEEELVTRYRGCCSPDNNRTIQRVEYWDRSNYTYKVATHVLLLFNKSKGYGSGCTTALIGMQRFLQCVLSKSAVTVHKPFTDQQWIGFADSARIQDQRSMCWLHTKHFDLSQ